MLNSVKSLVLTKLLLKYSVPPSTEHVPQQHVTKSWIWTDSMVSPHRLQRIMFLMIFAMVSRPFDLIIYFLMC